MNAQSPTATTPKFKKEVLLQATLQVLKEVLAERCDSEAEAGTKLGELEESLNRYFAMRSDPRYDGYKIAALFEAWNQGDPEDNYRIAEALREAVDRLSEQSQIQHADVKPQPSGFPVGGRFPSGQIIARVLAHIENAQMTKPQSEQFRKKDMANIRGFLNGSFGATPSTTGLRFLQMLDRYRNLSSANDEYATYYQSILSALESVKEQIQTDEFKPKTATNLPVKEVTAAHVAGIADLPGHTQVAAPTRTTTYTARKSKPSIPTATIPGAAYKDEIDGQPYSDFIRSHGKFDDEIRHHYIEIAKLLSNESQGMQAINYHGIPITAGWFRRPMSSEAQPFMATKSLGEVLSLAMRDFYKTPETLPLLAPEEIEKLASIKPKYYTLLSTLNHLGFSVKKADNPYKQILESITNATSNAQGVYPNGSLAIKLGTYTLRVLVEPGEDKEPLIAKESAPVLEQYINEHYPEDLTRRVAKGGNRMFSAGSMRGR